MCFECGNIQLAMYTRGSFLAFPSAAPQYV